MGKHAFAAVLALVVAAPCALGQMVVHAVSGTVTAVSPQTQTVELATDTNNTSLFRMPQGGSPSLEFEPDLRADTIAPSKFAHIGDYAVVYFYGYGDQRTAVAMKDLGPGPFHKVDATVTAFDKHTRTVALKDDAGKPLDLKLDEHLVVDTDESVDSGRKYTPHKGDRVRVTYTAANGGNDAVFYHFLH